MLLTHDMHQLPTENNFLDISPAYVLIGLAIVGGGAALFVIAAAVGLF